MRGPLREGAPEINSVHKSEVASIKPFGVFVRLEGYRTNGLVHVSQVIQYLPEANLGKYISSSCLVLRCFCLVLTCLCNPGTS